MPPKYSKDGFLSFSLTQTKEYSMKKQRLFVAFVLLGAFALIISLPTCSKSSKGGSDSNNDTKTERSGEGISVSDGGSKTESSGGKSIKLQVTGIPEKYNGEIIEFCFFGIDRYGWNGETSIQRPVALADGEISKGRVDLDLHDVDDNDISWAKPCDYYIEAYFLSVYEEEVYYHYTNGKTLKDLGFDTMLEAKGQNKKYPTYNLKTSGNTIDWEKQILKLDKNSTIGTPGIKITFKQIGENYPVGVVHVIFLYDSLEKFSNENKDVELAQREPVAVGSASVPTYGRDFDIYLYELTGGKVDEKKPWTKPGVYYLGVGLGGEHSLYYYTGGKTFEELGIEEYIVPKSKYGKLPMYKLELTGNTIDYGQIEYRHMDQGFN